LEKAILPMEYLLSNDNAKNPPNFGFGLRFFVRTIYLKNETHFCSNFKEQIKNNPSFYSHNVALPATRAQTKIS